jgi:RNA polymerase sigma factor (sigma-70 family)
MAQSSNSPPIRKPTALDAPTSLALHRSSPGLDEVTFDALYTEHAASVYNYVRYRSGDDEAEDVTAEIFVRVWRCRAQFRPDLGTPAAWLWAIARNAVKNHVRDRVAPMAPLAVVDRAGDHAGDPIPRGADLDEGALAHIAWGEVVAALERLAVVDREIIALRFGAGHTNRAIAMMLDLSEGAVAQRLRRALLRLRADLESAGPMHAMGEVGR